MINYVRNYSFLIITAFVLNLEAKDSFFITREEYGRMLYKEPRGISCNLCHGPSGESNLIVSYKHKGLRKDLVAPRITNVSKDRFTKAIKHGYSIMPKYELTDNEIEVLYFYLSSLGEQP